MALMKTAPAWISATRRCCSAGSRVQAEALEAERIIVGDLDGFVKRSYFEEKSYWPEELFTIDCAGAWEIDENGRFKVIPFADHALAPGNNASSRLNR